MAKESRINMRAVKKTQLPWVFTHNNKACNYPYRNQPYHIDIY